MNGFAKLYNSMLNSSVWVSQPKDVKILWVTILMMADANGFVETSLPGLAKAAELSLTETKAALDVLLSPDEYSKTKAHEGRRLRLVDRGLEIVNHGIYRKGLPTTPDARRVSESRSRSSEEGTTLVQNIDHASAFVNNKKGEMMVCPPDLDLSEAQKANLQISGTPKWAIDVMVCEAKSKMLADDSEQKTLIGWRRYLAAAVTRRWNNPNERPKQQPEETKWNN